jgi:urea transport system permease protein
MAFERVDGALGTRGARLVVYAALVALVACGPFFVSDFWLGVLPRFFVLGIFALSLDLLWGYTGLLSFGQGAFLGLGAYSVALVLKNWGASGSVGWTYLGLLLAILIPVAVAVALGYFMFYGRVSGVFFGIVTLSLTAIFHLIAVGSYSWTGGENGVTGVYAYPIGIPGVWELELGIANDRGNYYVAFVGAAIAFAVTRFIVASPAGRTMRAITASEARTESLGYNVPLIKIIVFATSAAIAGFAGALYAPLQLVNPGLFDLPLSVMAIIFVAVGGRGTLVGAFVGAVFVGVIEQLLASEQPELWAFLLGLMFVAVVLVLPRGIVGGLVSLWERMRARGRKPAEPSRVAPPRGTPDLGGANG